MLEKIGKYEIRTQLGRGAMGTVYEGFDPAIGRRVAVKTLRMEQFEPSQLAEVRERFKREAQSAGRLSHPHIVTIHEYGEEEGTPYIVMEYITGTELGVQLARGSRFSPGDIVRIMIQLLGALAHAHEHEHKVVHRDLKPANMFLLEDGSLKVVDFGIARVEASDLTETGAMLGTPSYMSPEQCLGIQVDHRSDIFSAGVILYQLLTGDKPFTGSVTTTIQKVLRHEPMPPSELNPTISTAWDKVVARAMAKKPEARYQSARQFAEAVKLVQQAERDFTVAIEVKDTQQEAAERERRESEERARQAAEARARAEAEARAKMLAESEAQARAEAARLGEEARRERERAEAEARARREGEARAKREAEERAAREAQERERQAADARARAENDAKTREETRRLTEEARRERERAEGEARARREAEARAAGAVREPGKAGASRAPVIAVALVIVAAVAGIVLVSRQSGEDQATKAEAGRVAAEARRRSEELAKREAEAKAKAEAARKAEEARQAAQRPAGAFRDCDGCPEMMPIPAGSFLMGSPASEEGRDNDEGPQHRVSISRPFAAGKYEVTFDEWDACVRDGGCSHNPADPGWGRGRRPVIKVSWRDAKQFAEWLSRKTGKRYRLLTEAEWEYVARAGTTTAYSTGSTISTSQANYSGTRTVTVGSYRPNAFGLYDVHGNVWEWTEDCWNASYSGAPSDGSAWLSGDCSRRVDRGGSSGNGPRRVRSANRDWDPSVNRFNVLGFRLARTLE